MWATTAPPRRPGSSRVSAVSNFTPRPALLPARNVLTRQLSGSTPGAALSVRTTTSSTRSASARIFGTVAASAGCAGSTCCVMKTSFAICRTCSEEVEVAEREIPGVASLVEAGAVAKGLADEAESLVRRHESGREQRLSLHAGRRRQEHERVGTGTHLVDCAHEQRASRLVVLRRSDEVGEETGRDAVLERVPDDHDACELARPVRGEAAILARRVEVAPVEVRRVANEVVAVGRADSTAKRVQIRPETLHRLHLEPAKDSR